MLHMTTCKRDEYDWEWPGEQCGGLTLPLADGDDVPEGLHILVHYHDNYFDCVQPFIDLKEAKALFTKYEQELWEQIQQCVYQPDGNGVVKRSKYQVPNCNLVSLEDRIFSNPDKGSTWMLLPYVLIES